MPETVRNGDPDRERLLRCARGEEPAELLLRDCRVVEVYSGEILTTDVALCEGCIAGLGPYRGRREVDLGGRFLAPGFIDGHIHLESSLLGPYQFARAAVPHGTTGVVCDPHEIANVAGVPGIQALLAQSEGLPLTVFVMAPSCVPASALESSGAVLSAQDIVPLLSHPRVRGLAEVMNFPGAVAGLPDLRDKINAALRAGLAVDGHAPGITGQALQAYLVAGPDSDHECSTLAEAREKLRAGMDILLREGSTARNLAALLPLVSERTVGRCLLVSDDLHPDELLREGHLDRILRRAVAQGLDPVLALRMVTWNVARRFGLRDRGAITPGRRADLVVLDDLTDFRVHAVYCGGVPAARDGEVVEDAWQGLPGDVRGEEALRSSVRVAWDTVDWRIPLGPGRMRVIGIVPGQLLTDLLELEPREGNGLALADPERDLAKLAVIERHRAGGGMALGFVRGLGLSAGALASTVAHDSHNLLVAGMDDGDMELAARTVAGLGGGLAVTRQGRVLASLALPLAGLMSPLAASDVAAALEELVKAAASLGARNNPFMILSFLALPVIGRLKLTDRGLVDSASFTHVPLWIGA